MAKGRWLDNGCTVQGQKRRVSFVPAIHGMCVPTVFALVYPYSCLQVAPNGWVDVSEFLSLGSNVIELNHHLDMSGYIFILRAHSPTKSQLEEVTQRYRKKQEWEEWLQHVSRPLDIPLPPFS